jgi:hypothetical protein
MEDKQNQTPSDPIQVKIQKQKYQTYRDCPEGQQHRGGGAETAEYHK